MMCWVVLKGSPRKEPHEDSENEGDVRELGFAMCFPIFE